MVRVQQRRPMVHGIDEIPIIDCPLQGIYPIGRCLNTRLALYSRAICTRLWCTPVHYNAAAARPAYYLRAVSWLAPGVAIYRHPVEFPPLATGYHS